MSSSSLDALNHDPAELHPDFLDVCIEKHISIITNIRTNQEYLLTRDSRSAIDSLIYDIHQIVNKGVADDIYTEISNAIEVIQQKSHEAKSALAWYELNPDEKVNISPKEKLADLLEVSKLGDEVVRLYQYAFQRHFRNELDKIWQNINLLESRLNIAIKQTNNSNENMSAQVQQIKLMRIFHRQLTEFIGRWSYHLNFGHNNSHKDIRESLYHIQDVILAFKNVSNAPTLSNCYELMEAQENWDKEFSERIPSRSFQQLGVTIAKIILVTAIIATAILLLVPGVNLAVAVAVGLAVAGAGLLIYRNSNQFQPTTKLVHYAESNARLPIEQKAAFFHSTKQALHDDQYLEDRTHISRVKSSILSVET